MKLIDFFRYIFRTFLYQIFEDIREIFEVVTKKKTWVYICFAFLIVSLFLKDLKLIILAAGLFLFFLITYQWAVFNEEYTHQQREQYWKRPKK